MKTQKKLRHVDGDAPLSVRSKGEEDKDSSRQEVEVGSSKTDSRINATCGSKDLCGSKTKRKTKKVRKTEGTDITFIVLQKMRSMNSSDRIEEMIREHEG